MSTERKWHAIYTRHRWEKKIAGLLEKKDIITYCPLIKKVSQWSDRKKVVYEPLFNCYVFVQVAKEEMVPVLETVGVLRFVYWLNKPAIIRDSEIDTIKKYLSENVTIEVEKMDIELNDEVRIINGPLMEYEGNVVAVLKNKVKVFLHSLQYVMIVEVEKGDIETIKKSARVLDDQMI